MVPSNGPLTLSVALICAVVGFIVISVIVHNFVDPKLIRTSAHRLVRGRADEWALRIALLVLFGLASYRRDISLAIVGLVITISCWPIITPIPSRFFPHGTQGRSYERRN
jgi:hypothetical protein